MAIKRLPDRKNSQVSDFISVFSSRSYWFLFVLLIASVALVGCNIFSWSSHDDAESLIDEGNRLMRDAEYDAAAEVFARAMAQNPNDSEARYYHAKAILHGSGFNSLYLGTIMTDTEFDGPDPFPFTGSEWPKNDADKLYQTVKVVRDDLTPILSGQTTGIFDSSDVDLDFALANAIDGILLIRDNDLNGKIDNSDFDFTFSYVSSTGMNFTNLDDYLATGSKAPKQFGQSNAAVDVDTLIVVFNNLLDSAEVVINRSRDIIEQILADDVGLDPEEIDKVLSDIIQMAHYFKINDPADNDGDGYVSKYGIGYDEEINAVDDDGDGLIDEDSRYPWDH